MIQRQLTKAQGHIVATLAEQQARLQQQLAETQEAVHAQAELLRAHYGLPEGTLSFNVGPDGGWHIVVRPDPEPAQEVADAEPADESGI